MKILSQAFGSGPDGQVGIFEPAHGSLGIKRPLFQRFRIPFAAAHGIEEIAPVHMDGPRGSVLICPHG